MGAAVGLASASAVVLRLLEKGATSLGPYLVADPEVTVIAPDSILSSSTTLNLFLYRVSRNAGWPDVPDRPPLHAPRPPGETSSRFGRLVVDMHYLVSAHSSKPLEAELMLGEALLTLHEHQHIGRKRITEILEDTSTVSPPMNTGAAQDLGETFALADQLESITITSEPLTLEQLSQLWSMLNTAARPSACFLVTAVMLERLEPRPIPRIVLSRGPIDVSGAETGPRLMMIPDAQAPRLSAADMDAGEPSALVGETVTLRGSGLSIGLVVELTRADDPIISVALTDADGVSGQLAIDGAAGEWHPGVYSARVLGAKSSSNALPLQLAPRVDWEDAVLGPPSGTPPTRELTLTFAPLAADGQEVILFVDGVGMRAESTGIAPNEPAKSRATFRVPDISTGAHPARLSVDGVDSHQLNRSTRPPSIRADQRLEVV